MKDEQQHSILLVIVAVATLIIAVIGATFAYFANIKNVDNSANITAKTGNSSTFEAYSTDEIEMNITSVSMQKNAFSTSSVSSDTALMTIVLVSGSSEEVMSCSYDLKFVWDGASLTSEKENEFWAYDKTSVDLPYTDPDTADTYNYEFSLIVDANYENASGSEGQANPFGEQSELFASSKENNFTTILGKDSSGNNNLEATIIRGATISTNNIETGAKTTYTFTANFYNLPVNQNLLINKTFKGHFEVTNVNC